MISTWITESIKRNDLHMTFGIVCRFVIAVQLSEIRIKTTNKYAKIRISKLYVNSVSLRDPLRTHSMKHYLDA